MTPKQLEAKRAAAMKALPEIRSTLEAEATLLLDSYDPKLVVYCCVTTAIKLAARNGIDVGEFADLVAKTINLYSGGNNITVVELDEE